MEKRFFAHYERVTGKAGGTVSFRVPDEMRFEMAQVVIKENTELANAGGALLDISTVSNEYKTVIKIPADFITRKGDSEFDVVSGGFISTQQFDGVKIPFSVSGGDTINIEVNTLYTSTAVVDVMIVGKKVGEF